MIKYILVGKYNCLMYNTVDDTFIQMKNHCDWFVAEYDGTIITTKEVVQVNKGDAFCCTYIPNIGSNVLTVRDAAFVHDIQEIEKQITGQQESDATC